MNKVLLKTILGVAVICGLAGVFSNNDNDMSDLCLSNIEALTLEVENNSNQTCTRPIITHDCYRYDNNSRVWMWAAKAIDAVETYQASSMEPCQHAFVTPCPPGTKARYNGY